MTLLQEPFPEGAVRHPQYTVTKGQVHHHTLARLQDHLGLPDYGRSCPSRTLLNVVLTAAAHLTSLFAVCRRLAHAPSGETARKALLAALPERAALLRRLNRALAADLPKALRHRRPRLAADLTLLPYHGEPFEHAREVYRSQPRSGTSHFHAYATAYLVEHGQRFTVAFTAVDRGEDLAAVLQRLLRQAARAGVRPGLVLLDRGFFSVGVIRYLQAARCQFVMPVVFRGRRPDHPLGPSGTNVFRCWRRSGWGRYTLTNAAGTTATVSVCVKCRNYRGQWKRHGRQPLVYAYWGFVPPTCDWVRETYRQRFGIEASYRQLRQARVRTTTRNPVVRLFYVGVGLLLRNVWVWLHWQVLSTPRRGSRRLNLHRLGFQTFLHWLGQVVEELLGISHSIQAERPL